MRFGTVKYFDVKKGHGLIALEDGSQEIVVEQSEVNRAGLGQIAARQKLGFDIAAHGSKPRAVNLWATFGGR